MSQTTFELWDLESGNAIGGFDSEFDALAAVRDAITTHGRPYASQWGLARVTRRSMRSIASHDALIERAVGSGATSPVPPSATRRKAG